MPTWTFFVVDAEPGASTTWIEGVTASTLEEAKVIALVRCAEAWGQPMDTLHILGVAEGEVKIVEWEG